MAKAAKAGADGTTQEKAHTTSFIFPSVILKIIVKLKTILKKSYFTLQQARMQKGINECCALPFRSLDQAQSCHHPSSPVLCSQFAQALH